MRLLYLSGDPGVPVFGHKGASVHVRELCAAFAGEGVAVHIASPRIEPEGDCLMAPAVLHEITPVQPRGQTPARLRDEIHVQSEEVTDLAARLKVDAIYERFSLFSLAGVRAAETLGLPHVLEVNSPLREEAFRYRCLPNRDLAATVEAEVMAATDRALVVSEPLAAALVRDGVDRAKIEISPNGVAAERFAHPRRDPTRFVVGFAGSLKPWHGIDVLIEAVARVPEAHLEVVGHGPLEGMFDRLQDDQLTRLGARPHAEVIELMAGWDVGVAPYAPIRDFWFSPLKVLEYMAAGACPVASDLGDAAELLGDGRRGVLVQAGDAAALAAALAGLAADRERTRVLGARARGWVAAHRSWSANASRALALLQTKIREAA